MGTFKDSRESLASFGLDLAIEKYQFWASFSRLRWSMISVSPSTAARRDKDISLLFRKRRHELVDSELDAQKATLKFAQICPFLATCWTSQWSISSCFFKIDI